MGRGGNGGEREMWRSHGPLPKSPVDTQMISGQQQSPHNEALSLRGWLPDIFCRPHRALLYIFYLFFFFTFHFKHKTRYQFNSRPHTSKCISPPRRMVREHRTHFIVAYGMCVSLPSCVQIYIYIYVRMYT